MYDVLAEIEEAVYNDVKTHFDKPAINPIMQSEFLSIMLKQESEKMKVTYPREIKIARPVKEILAGNSEPAKILKLNNPITYNGMEMWQGDASKDIHIHFGLENSDKRFLSNFKIDSSDKAHMFVGGSTGSGKSVTLNSIIFSLLYLYSPWELRITLVDPKVVEFARYGTTHHIPHLDKIAACSDGGYILSVVKDFHHDMMQMQELFAMYDVQNLADLRKTTGMVFPRHVLVLDEAQFCFKRVGKKHSSELQTLLDDIARVGRSSGFNLIAATQEFSSEVKQMANNLPIRAALKCNTAEVSESILGNNEGALGSDVGVGKIYVTDNAASKDKSQNHLFKVPFQNKEEFTEQGIFLEEEGKTLELTYKTLFYNENVILSKENFKELCNSKDDNSIVLGVPSFVSEDPRRYQLKFDNTDIENIMVFCPESTSVKTLFETLYINALKDRESDKVKHDFLIADKGMLGEYIPANDGFVANKISATSNSVWTKYKAILGCRRIIIECDDEIFGSGGHISDKSIELGDKVADQLGMPSLKDNELYKKRIYQYIVAVAKEENRAVFGLTGYGITEQKIKEAVPGAVLTLVSVLKGLGSKYLERRVSKETLQTRVIHVVGASRILGIGRDVKNTDEIKHILFDSCAANMRFIFYTVNCDEMIAYKSAFPYVLMDKTEQFTGKVGCECYPDEVPDVCGVLFKRSENKCVTFKKLKGDD